MLEWFGDTSLDWSLIEVQHIANALPETDSEVFLPKSADSKLEYFSCGDYMVHGSVEGALLSAKKTVEQVRVKLAMNEG